MVTTHQTEIALLPTQQLTDSAPSKASAHSHRFAEIPGILTALGLLAVIIYRNVKKGLIVYPDPKLSMGDYYRYINMAIPHGDQYYGRMEPFVYRILVPDTVHLFIGLGIPYYATFFCITSVCLTVSTIAVYALARGYHLGRVEATCAAMLFLLLEWAVSYNIHDYFLVDPAAQMFIVLILLAVQHERWNIAIILGAIGIISKESVLLAVFVDYPPKRLSRRPCTFSNWHGSSIAGVRMETTRASCKPIAF